MLVRNKQTIVPTTVANARAKHRLQTTAVYTSVSPGSTNKLTGAALATINQLPVVAEMERVMDATTLPTLLLGGDPSGRPEETYASWRDALALPAVRGLVIGRTLLYPPDDDVATAVDAAVALVH